jgi:hypothetical protein
VVAILITYKRIRRELPYWIGPLGAVNLGTGVGELLHHEYYGIGFVVFGVVCLVVANRRSKRAAAVRTRHQILLAARIYPGLQTDWLSAEIGIKPRRLQPLLDRLVDEGELVQRPEGGYVYRAIEQPTVR